MSCTHTTCSSIHTIMSCIHTTHTIHTIMSCIHIIHTIHTIMSCTHTIHTIHTIMSITHTTCSCIHTTRSITHTPLHLLIERSMNVQQRVAHHHQLRGVHHRPHLREHYASHHHASPTLPSPLLLAPPTRVHRP